MTRGQGWTGAEPDISPYRPAWWLAGPHAQTVAGRLLRRGDVSSLRRERINTPDGDFLDLDFTPLARDGHPVVLLLHGLEGSARRGYALNTYRELESRGIGAVGLNFRSCSGEPNRLARSYHSGDTGDLAFVLEWIEHRLPRSPTAAVGFSLGGNVLLKWLGENGDVAAGRLVACAAASVPFDLAACADVLDSTRIGRFYVRRFLNTLIAKVEAKREILAGRIDIERVLASRSFREFDDAATAPLHGFRDADDYYARSSSAGFLEHIRVPTLVLHAEDDPFMPGAALPRDVLRSNPSLHPVITRNGGHVGFITGRPWAPRYWAEREAAAFLAARFAAAGGSAES